MSLGGEVEQELYAFSTSLSAKLVGIQTPLQALVDYFGARGFLGV